VSGGGTGLIRQDDRWYRVVPSVFVRTLTSSTGRRTVTRRSSSSPLRDVVLEVRSADSLLVSGGGTGLIRQDETGTDPDSGTGDVPTTVLIPTVAKLVQGKKSPLTGQPVQVIAGCPRS
jgi:hypothetical protein